MNYGVVKNKPEWQSAAEYFLVESFLFFGNFSTPKFTAEAISETTYQKFQ